MLKELGKRYIWTSLALLIFLLVINRASYYGIYVEMILVFSFYYFYRTNITSKLFDFWAMVFIFYLIIGIIHLNNPKDILFDSFHLLPIPVVVLSSQAFRRDYLSNQFQGLRRLLPFFILLYFLIFNYMGYNWRGSEDLRFDYDQTSHMSLNAPLRPLFLIIPFLCIQKFKGNKIQKICLVIGALAFLHLGFITSTKSWSIGVMTVISLRLILNRHGKSQLNYIVLLSLISLIAIYIVNEYLFVFIDRFFNKFDFDDSSNTSRWDEGISYLKQCNGLQLLFGKGFGGLKIFHERQSYIGGATMLHMGWCYLIMKGGILLLLIIYYPLFYIIVKDYQERNYEYVIWAIYMLFADQMHTTFSDINIIYWFIVYLRFYHRSRLPNYVKT